MAEVATKLSFPKSGGLKTASGAVSVNAGNGLAVNPNTGMVEVPIDTAAGLGYGSNGLEVEVDDSTIGFNASGQLTALSGGGGGINYYAGIIEPVGTGTTFGNITAYSQATSAMFAAFLYGDAWALLVGCWRKQVAYDQAALISVFNSAKKGKPKVNGYQTTEEETIIGACNYLFNTSIRSALVRTNYAGYDGGAIIKFNPSIDYSSFNTPLLFTWE